MELQEIEYFESWVAYHNADQEDYDWDYEFDTKEAAKAYLKRMGYYNEGKIKCCLSVDANLSGKEYAYGNTKAEAMRNLKEQIKPYGYKPYNPFEIA